MVWSFVLHVTSCWKHITLRLWGDLGENLPLFSDPEESRLSPTGFTMTETMKKVHPEAS